MSRNRLFTVILSSAVAHATAGKGDVKSTNAKAKDTQCQRVCDWDPFREYHDDHASKCRTDHPVYVAMQRRGDETFKWHAGRNWRTRCRDSEYKGTCIGRYVTSTTIEEELSNLRMLDRMEMWSRHDGDRWQRNGGWSGDQTEQDKQKTGKEASVLVRKDHFKERFYRGRAFAENIRLHDPVVEGKNGGSWRLQTGEKIDDSDQHGDQEENNGDQEGNQETGKMPLDDLPATGTFACTMYTVTAGEIKIKPGDTKVKPEEKSVGSFELKHKIPLVHASGEVAKKLKEDADLEIADFSNLKNSGKEVENLTLYWGGPLDAKFYGFGMIRFKDEPEDSFQITQTGERVIECVPEAADEDDSWLTIIIVCSVVGGVVIIVVICYCVWFRKSSEEDESEEDDEESCEGEDQYVQDPQTQQPVPTTSLTMEQTIAKMTGADWQGDSRPGIPSQGVATPQGTATPQSGAASPAGYQPFVFATPGNNSHGHHAY